MQLLTLSSVTPSITVLYSTKFLHLGYYINKFSRNTWNNKWIKVSLWPLSSIFNMNMLLIKYVLCFLSPPKLSRLAWTLTHSIARLKRHLDCFLLQPYFYTWALKSLSHNENFIMLFSFLKKIIIKNFYKILEWVSISIQRKLI